MPPAAQSAVQEWQVLPRDDEDKTKVWRETMTAVEKLEIGVFASLLIIVLPAVFISAHMLVG
jgi:hypothetical protein